jgi:epoxyqueuosine reductase QueG
MQNENFKMQGVAVGFIRHQENYQRLKERSVAEGAALFGVANITNLKKDFLIATKTVEKFDAGISLAVRLSEPILEEIEDHPTKLYYHHYRQANQFLDQLAFRLSLFIQEQGYRALSIPASQIVDWQTQQGHLSHKKIALQAGLGWLGRNNLLVNKKLGSRIRLVTILTDMPLNFDVPVTDTCGECRLCISACPASAIQDDQKEFAHLKCFDQLKDFQKKGYVGQYICGICVKACPGTPEIPSKNSLKERAQEVRSDE